MFSRIWLINFILAVCVGFLGVKACGVWSGGPEIRTEVRFSKPEKQVVEGFKRVSLPLEKTFEAVVEKNLFSPDRSESKPEQAKGTGPEPVSDAEVEEALKGTVLYGVVIMDDHREALVVEGVAKKAPFRGKGSRPKPGGSEARWISIGDDLGGYKVAGISAEKVSLTAGQVTYDLFLYDKGKPKSRTGLVAAPAPTVVVQTGAQKVPQSVVQTKGDDRATAARPVSGRAVTSREANPNPFQKAAAAKNAAGSAPGTRTKSGKSGSENPFERVLRKKGALQGN